MSVCVCANLIVIHGNAVDWIALNSSVFFRDDLTRQCAKVCITISRRIANSTAAIRQRHHTIAVIWCYYWHMTLHTASKSITCLCIHYQSTHNMNHIWLYVTVPMTREMTCCDDDCEPTVANSRGIPLRQSHSLRIRLHTGSNHFAKDFKLFNNSVQPKRCKFLQCYAKNELNAP